MLISLYLSCVSENISLTLVAASVAISLAPVAASVTISLAPVAASVANSLAPVAASVTISYITPPVFDCSVPLSELLPLSESLFLPQPTKAHTKTTISAQTHKHFIFFI